MRFTNWVVVTGPPSSGKTTLIQGLQARGLTICPESAREIIQYSLSAGFIAKCLRHDKLKLQRQILSVSLKREHQLDCAERIFFDRGTPDSIAYFKLYGFDLQPAIRASMFRRYQHVIYCEGLPIVRDGLRQESDVEAKKIGELLLEAYRMLGYRPICLPVLPPEERLAFLLQSLVK
jgi:predicted ATPase